VSGAHVINPTMYQILGYCGRAGNGFERREEELRGRKK
jgi:hypothetical protein